MNKGLKSYTNQITKTVGNVGEVSVNINNNDANLIMRLPLFKTIGLSPIDLSLIFNYQNRIDNKGFGNGFKLNFYSALKETGGVHIENADGSIDYYNINGSRNQETDCTLTYFDVNGTNFYLDFKDKFGNIKHYTSYQDDYPKYIQMIDGTRIDLSMNSGTKTITNNKNSVVTMMTTNGMVTRIEYKESGTLLYYVTIEYANGNISRIKHYKESVCIKEVVLTISSSVVIIADNIKSHTITYAISNNKVTSISDTHGSSSSKNISLSYNGNKTTVTDNNGEKTYFIFNSNGMPLYQMDNNGNVIETKYDIITKKMISQSSPINVKNRLTNLFPGINVNYFVASGVSVTSTEVAPDSFYFDALGSEAFKVEGTGTLSYSIDTNGLATDNVTLVIFGKQLSAYSASSNVKITLSADTSILDTFKKEAIDDDFEMMVLGVSAKSSYRKISVTITLTGGASIVLGGVQVLKKDFGAFYEYDNGGNVSGVKTGTGSIELSNNSSNMVSSSIDACSTMSKFTYDEKGNLLAAKQSYGVNLENEYDSTLNLLTRSAVKNSDSTKVLEVTKSYDSSGNLVSESDELLNNTTYEYDAFGKVIKAIDALGGVTNYTYDAFDSLKKIIVSKGSNSINATYSYDSKHRLLGVQLTNGSIYSFSYDNRDNILTVSLNGTVIYSFTYDLNGVLTNQRYGESGDSYRFEYDDNLISKVYYVDPNGTESLKYQYEYDLYKRLSRVNDASGNTLAEYSYDNDSQVVSVTGPNSNLYYQYDNLGNVSEKRIEVSSHVINQSYDQVTRSRGNHPDAIMDLIQSNSKYLATFFSNTTKIKNGTYSISATNLKGIVTLPTYLKEGIVPCVYAGTDNPMSYRMSISSSFEYPCESIGFWFYPTVASGKKYLFSIRRPASSGYGLVAVYMNDSKKLVLEVTDINNNTQTLITSKYTVNLGEWNFFNLNWMNRDDGNGYTNVCEYMLTLNSHSDKYLKINPRLCVEIGNPPVFHIGYLRTTTGTSNPLDCKITGLMIGVRTCLQQAEVMEYYRLTKDYITFNEVIDGNIKATEFSGTNLHTINPSIQSNFDIYPLQNSVISLLGNKPVSFSIRNKSANDKDRTFNFNNVNKHYCYVADGSELSYQFGMYGTGTIMLRAFFDGLDDRQYVFESKDTEGHTLGLYRGSNDYLFVDINGQVYNTNLICYSRIWYTLALSYTNNVSGDSNIANTTSIRVYWHNGTTSNTFTTSVTLDYVYKLMTTAIGRKHEAIHKVSNLGEYDTYYPLLGQIEMMAVRSAYCEEQTLNTLQSELVVLSKIREYDEMGLLRKTKIHKCDTNILSNTLSYKTRSDSKYISRNISNEVINIGQITINRSYTSDALGNVTGVTDSIFGTHTYEYDYRGFLTKEDGVNYTYDGNGNILTAGTDTFTYDSGLKDRLASVNGVSVLYSPNNPGNPRKFGSRTYNFEGRRLVYVKDEITSTEFISSTYTYNDRGLITKRVVNHWYLNLSDTWSKETNYYYDGDRLVTEITPEHRNDYLYDENGNLYGFIQDFTYKYFYVRDFMQNILGIVDINGTLVVKYNYDAYGNLKSYTGTNVYNPMRYKGYYYDDSVDMYYCHSRFYVPTWRRWLNFDSVSFIDTTDIAGTRLYVYCNNNPVMYSDGEGHFAIISFLVGLGISSLIGATVGAGSYAVGQVVNYFTTGEFSWSWGGFIGATIGGGIGGALTFGFGISGGAFGAFLSGAITECGTMIGENISDNAGYSAGDILINSVVVGFLSALCSGIMNGIKVKGLNAGRGSWSAVNKQIITKLHNGSISRITGKTFGKMLGVAAYSSIASIGVDEVYGYSGTENWILNFF